MKSVIFTFDKAPPKRVSNAKYLAERTGADIHIGGFDTIKNTTDICKKYEDDLLIFEDDVSLCDDFEEHARKVIDLYPDDVINFHYSRLPCGEYIKGPDHLKLYKTDGSRYICNPCFYIPNKVREIIIESEASFRKTYPYFVRMREQDVFIAYCIRDLSFIAVYPSLVYHLPFGSSLRNEMSAKTLFPFDLNGERAY